MTVVAYLGPEGTFAEQAARALAPGEELVSAVSVHTAISALRAGEVDAACVPVENSVEGSVPATLDAMVEGEPVLAIAEAVLPVQFSVLVRPGTVAAEVRVVATHPHAAAQVRSWLGTHLPEATTMLTTSTSAGAVAGLEGQSDAAICAPVELVHYPLT
ncbi:MAG: prephenate dehydratase domain-containing protein [Pseudonocardiaceae bacterium]